MGFAISHGRSRVKCWYSQRLQSVLRVIDGRMIYDWSAGENKSHTLQTYNNPSADGAWCYPSTCLEVNRLSTYFARWSTYFFCQKLEILSLRKRRHYFDTLYTGGRLTTFSENISTSKCTFTLTIDTASPFDSYYLFNFWVLLTLLARYSRKLLLMVVAVTVGVIHEPWLAMGAIKRWLKTIIRKSVMNEPRTKHIGYVCLRSDMLCC
jgi:hypothetical protein